MFPLLFWYPASMKLTIFVWYFCNWESMHSLISMYWINEYFDACFCNSSIANPIVVEQSAPSRYLAMFKRWLKVSVYSSRGELVRKSYFLTDKSIR